MLFGFVLVVFGFVDWLFLLREPLVSRSWKKVGVIVVPLMEPFTTI